MWVIAVAAALLIATSDPAPVKPVVLPKPGFPAPARELTPRKPHLELVSSRYVSPAQPPPAQKPPPYSVPKRYLDADLRFTIGRPRGELLVVYGGRYLVKTSQDPYVLDFVNYMRPPNGAWLEEILWAHESRRILYVAHAHLTYATATRGRNAYVSAIDLDTNRLLWRSPALVANARTFVVARDVIVSGYGFTRELDFLYLLDRKTGRVLDRLPVPSAPEIIERRGDRLEVRTYDRKVVARIVR